MVGEPLKLLLVSLYTKRQYYDTRRAAGASLLMLKYHSSGSSTRCFEGTLLFMHLR